MCSLVKVTNPGIELSHAFRPKALGALWLKWRVSDAQLPSRTYLCFCSVRWTCSVALFCCSLSVTYLDFVLLQTRIQHMKMTLAGEHQLQRQGTAGNVILWSDPASA